MNAPSSVFRLTSAPVHPVAASTGLDKDQTAAFVVRRLIVGFAGLAAAPIVLVLHGVPTLAETLVFACGFAPLAAAMTATRAGNLVAAHSIAAAGLTALGLILWLGLGCGAACAVAWLFAAHVETKLAASTRLSRAADAAVAMALFLIVLGALIAGATATQAASSTVWTGLALAYAWMIGGGAWTCVTRLHQVEDEAAAWHAIAQAIDDVVIGFDDNGNVLRVRSAPRSEAETTPDTLLGTGFLKAVHVEDRSAFQEVIEAAAIGETTVARLRLRTEVIGADHPASDQNGYRAVLLRARRVASNASSGVPSLIVAVMRDIEPTVSDVPEQDKAAALVQVSTPEARGLSTMAHELRTPLNAIIGFSQILASRTLSPSDPAKQREYARIIDQSGQHLLSIVNSIFEGPKVQPDTFAAAVASFESGASHQSNFQMPRMKEVA